MDDGQVREGLPTIPAQRCRLILNNWARWLVLDRIGFHVVISFFDSLQKVAAYGLMFVLTASFLFRPEARAYFQRLDQTGT